MCAVAVNAAPASLASNILLTQLELKALQAKINRLMRAGLLSGFPIFESGEWDMATSQAWRQFQSQYAMEAPRLFAPGISMPSSSRNGEHSMSALKQKSTAMDARQWQVDHSEGPLSQMTTPDVPIELAQRMFPLAKAETIHNNAPLVAKALLSEGLDHTNLLLLAFATVRAETDKFESLPEKVNRSGDWNNTFEEDFDVYEPYKDNTATLDRAIKAHQNDKHWNRPKRVPGQAHSGNSQPGDGAKYKGRGFIQLTTRERYEAADKDLHLGIKDDPDKLVNDVYASARVLAWYLKVHRTSEDTPAARRRAFERNDLPMLRRIFSGGGPSYQPPGMARFEASYWAGKQYFREGFAMMVLRRGLMRRVAGPL